MAKVKPRRVTLVIDQLNSGGAQRDLVSLAVDLKRHGYSVQVLFYWEDYFFASELEEAGIPFRHVQFRSKMHLIYAMRKVVRASLPDVVIGFLHGPGMLAELSGLFSRRFGVIVLELSLDKKGRNVRRVVRYQLHRLADVVVCNSYSQMEVMRELAPYLNDRLQVIVNGVDLKRFQPIDGAVSDGSDQLRILVIGRFQAVKNPLRLLDAIEIVRNERRDLDVAVDWYGDPTYGDKTRIGESGDMSTHRSSLYYRELESAITQRGLGDVFRLHDEVKDVAPLYHSADVFCLPSLHEGTSNVICEAMASGLPVLASRVSDNPRLVMDGENGFLFDPMSPRDMAEAIMRFGDTPVEVRRRMGVIGRRMAESMLSPDVRTDQYVDLIEHVIARKGIS